MNSILYFSNLSAALLYKYELEGQISDGKYENSRPFNHWEWINDTTIVVDPDHKEGTTRWVRKVYNLNEWFKYMHDGENDWAWRIMAFARFGKMFEGMTKIYPLLLRSCEYVANVLPADPSEQKLTRELLDQAFEDEVDHFKRRLESYTDHAKYASTIDWCNTRIADLQTVRLAITDEMIEIYNDLSYTEKSLKATHESMKRTVNTQL